MNFINQEKAKNEVEVISTYSLSKEEINNIKKKLLINEDVEIKNTIDQSIIGGLIIKDNSNIIDLSVKSFLEKIKKSLL